MLFAQTDIRPEHLVNYLKDIDKLGKSLRKLERQYKYLHSQRDGISQLLSKPAELFGVLSPAGFEESSYPQVPGPFIPATRGGFGLPEDSGIYFVWSDNVCVYVGKSISICKRATVCHTSILDSDWLSWVLIPKNTLDFAECFYIGVCKPSRNFGRFNKHTNASCVKTEK